MEFYSRATNSGSVLHRAGSYLLFLSTGLAVLVILGSTRSASGQMESNANPRDVQVETHAVALTLSRVRGSEWRDDDAAERPSKRQWNTRQALLIGGLAASMAAYGYFILEFNNSRGAAGSAERAYEEDVRQNAQTYIDQGIELDQIQTFRDWQAAFDDAKRSREWGARSGFLAIVIGFFAVLDVATTHDGPPPSASGLTIRPTVGLTPLRSDLLVGARLKF